MDTFVGQACPARVKAKTIAPRTARDYQRDAPIMGRRNLIKHDDGRTTLRFRHGKTGVGVEIEVIGELAIALAPFMANPTLHPTFVRREDGKPYIVDGIGAMFRRYCAREGRSRSACRNAIGCADRI